MAMHAKPDLRVEFEHSDHFFRLGDLGRYPTLGIGTVARISLPAAMLHAQQVICPG